MTATALEEHLRLQAERSQEFFWNRLRWQLVFDFLPLDRQADLVDVGAGPGFLGDAIREKRPNISYRFIEPLESLESRNVERFGADANFREKADFGDSAFVTLLDVLEHQEDDYSFMRELSEKMAPGSLLLLTVPALPSLWSEWDVALGHYRRYKKGSLVNVVADLPFQVEEVSYLFPELIPMGWMRKLKSKVQASSDPDSASAEFPDLPGAVNEGLYRCGHLTMKQRQLWPAGTSVFAAIRRTL